MEGDFFNFEVEVDERDGNEKDPSKNNTATTTRSDLRNYTNTVYRRGQKRPKKKKVKVIIITQLRRTHHWI